MHLPRPEQLEPLLVYLLNLMLVKGQKRGSLSNYDELSPR